MSDSLARVEAEVRSCTKCRLYKSAQCGVPGEGPARARIMVVGQAPGAEEDKSGRPFVGRSGKFLVTTLQKLGLSRKDVFMTSVVKHFPPKNRVPRADEISACFPYLERQLLLVAPRTVVLLGNVALRALHHHPLLKNKNVILTVHPSAAMRFPAMRKKFEADMMRLKRVISGMS
ncbi:uracil-DNA glycosylase [Candidatus Woesearchaeota archaeon]|nr:uracil-DNA glycosylase [Candidatus Woesearchaeota archaeon]